MRWNDAGYDRSADIELCVLVGPPYSSRNGFIFHDACWSLLEEASYPAPVPLQRLLEVCKSLPITFDGSTLNWGHDFGGAAIVGNVSYFPWESRYVARRVPETDPAFGKNPYQVPEVDYLLFSEDPEQPPTPTVTTPSS